MRNNWTDRLGDHGKFEQGIMGDLIIFLGNRGIVKYSIHSGDPGYFIIDPVSGSIKIANPLDHEAHSQVLLNIQTFSSENPAIFGHTQVSWS